MWPTKGGVHTLPLLVLCAHKHYCGREAGGTDKDICDMQGPLPVDILSDGMTSIMTTHDSDFLNESCHEDTSLYVTPS